MLMVQRGRREFCFPGLFRSAPPGPPRRNAPYREAQLDGVQCSAAVEAVGEVEHKPRRVPDRPQVEAPCALADVEDCPGEAQGGYKPGQACRHWNSPPLHRFAYTGSRSLNIPMASSGFSSRSQLLSSPSLSSRKHIRTRGLPILHDMAQYTRFMVQYLQKPAKQ